MKILCATASTFLMPHACNHNIAFIMRSCTSQVRSFATEKSKLSTPSLYNQNKTVSNTANSLDVTSLLNSGNFGKIEVFYLDNQSSWRVHDTLSVIQALGKRKRASDVLLWMNRIPNATDSKDLRVHNTIINALSKCGEHKRMLDWFQRISTHGEIIIF